MKLCLLVFLLVTTSAFAKTIKVAAIDWCPQICPEQKEKGYVVDLVEEIYRDSDYQLQVDYFPWSRAIKYVLAGKYHALLSPAKAEAPQLRYPASAVGQQEMCFFTTLENQWQYRGIDSLSKMQIGIAIDTSIEELNHYVSSHSDQFVFQPYHERYIKQSAQMLTKNRIDAFLFTKNSTLYELKQAKMWHDFRIAGCVSRTDIFMAFTPNAKEHNAVDDMMLTFDTRAKQLNIQQILEQLLIKYNLQ
ncbi:transporter substrate-binding domain-containing protein [Pseudoalteromonas sp. S16_S37]|uniref:transporter substrate-binding domain-containing protein n=1 Tax=Pseudoalteromonas sp. S16_S37 TaxID=2720228 RepID=UPI00168044AF|nr:transporter substrate-binding domain-containing protein [Pseudoalteromonas sp. S16_S37]MBD1582289.1 amino acid ABC transporter substrate-binding protein [Pseudoalteromonas sp. S16_S37]